MAEKRLLNVHSQKEVIVSLVDLATNKATHYEAIDVLDDPTSSAQKRIQDAVREQFRLQIAAGNLRVFTPKDGRETPRLKRKAVFDASLFDQLKPLEKILPDYVVVRVPPG